MKEERVIVRREEPPQMPSNRLVALTGIVEAVAEAAGGEQYIPEVVDALWKLYDGDTMLYDGSWEGLKQAIDGNPCEEYSGYNERVDLVSELFDSSYWTREGEARTFNGTDGLMKASDIMVSKEDGQKLLAAMRAIFCPEHVEPPSFVGTKSKEKFFPAISGPTIDRLQRSIAAFPERYPEYQTKPPKLDDDVRPWLKESGLGENEAERRVFGAIIREHFQL